MSDPRLPLLSELERKALWLSTWMIHNANHLRDNPDGMKVGGHQSSSASLATVMTALYCAALRPEDRVAVKPHASPIFHAFQYLFGHLPLEKMQNFRGYKGVQSYPSRTKDRPMPEPALFGADLPGRRRLAQAAHRRSRRSRAGDTADRAALGCRTRGLDEQPRRARPADAGRGFRGGPRA